MSRPKSAGRRGSVPGQGSNVQAAIRPKDAGRQVSRPWPGIGSPWGAVYGIWNLSGRDADRSAEGNKYLYGVYWNWIRENI